MTFALSKQTVWMLAVSASAAAAAVLLSTSLSADPFCPTAYKVNWMSVVEVEQQIKSKGLRLISLRISEDRCYKAIAINSTGDQYDIFIHPVTGKILQQARAR